MDWPTAVDHVGIAFAAAIVAIVFLRSLGG